MYVMWGTSRPYVATLDTGPSFTEVTKFCL